MRRLAGRLRFACLPTPATLADFDVDAAAGIVLAVERVVVLLGLLVLVQRVANPTRT